MARSAIGKLWGPSLKQMKWIYETMVRPILTYGSIVWVHRATLYLKHLQRAQTVALLCLGAYARRTPTLGLEVLYGYMPLDLKAQLEAECAAIHIQYRNPQRWDYIGFGNRRGHLHHYRTQYGETDKINLTYQWQGLPEPDIGDGRPLPCLLYTSPSPRDKRQSRMPSSA